MPNQPLLVNTGDTTHPIPISQAILEGYAPGNELYTYTVLPKVSLDELTGIQNTSYADIFYFITKRLLGDALPDEILRTTANEAYSSNNFDLDESDNNLRFTKLSNGIELVGLSDGPTGAFKDMAMQPFARWMSYLQAQTGKQLSILLSTSGDTGPAALHAFGNLPNTEIIAMLPKSGVSPFQWAQMAELDNPDSGTHVLEVKGGFSDINDIHMQADLVYDLSAVNSVNIARIIAQVPYHVASYLKALSRAEGTIGNPVDMSIPSGNFGNALAAIIARKMGVPIRNIMIATNENNTLDTFFDKKVLKLSEFQHTDSSAQDVKMPSNVWRYLAMLFNNNTDKIRQTYEILTEKGSVDIANVGIEDLSVFDNIYSLTITANERHNTMRETYQLNNKSVIVDPHTANSIVGAIRLVNNMKDSSVPVIAYETAKPFKFDSVIEAVLGITPPRPARFTNLEKQQASKQLTQIADTQSLIDYLAKHTHAQMK